VYLIVAEAKDGNWWDQGRTTCNKRDAHDLARHLWVGRVPEGHTIMIYPLGRGEMAEWQETDLDRSGK
jgi:hypothetical protein